MMQLSLALMPAFTVSMAVAVPTSVAIPPRNHINGLSGYEQYGAFFMFWGLVFLHGSYFVHHHVLRSRLTDIDIYLSLSRGTVQS